MNKQEMKTAFAIAKEQTDNGDHLDNHTLAIFAGFGLRSFKPVNVTISAVAQLIRWQALQFNGEWNAEALNEIANAGRRKFRIIG